jgi:hypothetical protein
LEDLVVDIKVTKNTYDIELDKLFGMAARINKKRAFLFVSKVLGKHIPVDPSHSLTIGAALATRYMEEIHNSTHPYKEQIINALNGEKLTKENLEILFNHTFLLPTKTLFIGFAETATALGHSVFNCFANANYLHTTREDVNGISSIINFEEEHSHATSHKVYVDEGYFANENPIFLIDDEITTGKTTLNIIESIQKKYPRKEYSILSILDWRSEERINQYRETEKKLGIKIHAISLISGEIDVKGKPITDFLVNDTSHKNNQGASISKITVSGHVVPYNSKKDNLHYLNFTGRFGLSHKQKNEVNEFVCRTGKLLQSNRKGSKTLCIGTGEFMYLPMRIAYEMGTGVNYQSSTRSPIHPSFKIDYAVKNKYIFESIDDPSVMNYLYNIESGTYDEIFLFFEKDYSIEDLKQITDQLIHLVSHIHIVTFKNEEGEENATNS